MATGTARNGTSTIRRRRYQFYLDGTQVSLSGNAAFDVPPVFSQVRVGWNNYQSAPPGFVAWIDEVAMDVARIGCGN